MGGIGERGCNFERMFAFCIEFGQANTDDLDPADDRLTSHLSFMDFIEACRSLARHYHNPGNAPGEPGIA
jgi:hypothetical protein